MAATIGVGAVVVLLLLGFDAVPSGAIGGTVALVCRVVFDDA